MEPVVVKKYENRRLYNTVESRYINLEEITALIRQGGDVQVVDAKTGEDLTRSVLTQIVMEQAKDQRAGLPLDLLRQIIIATDHVQQQFLTWYLRNAFETYHKLQENLQSRLTDVGSVAMAPFQRVREMIAGALAPEADPEVQRLKLRVAELEDQLSRATVPTEQPARRARKRPTAKRVQRRR
jgi:polyhydroxyalkanoate synthesis repressor PhaR